MTEADLLHVRVRDLMTDGHLPCEDCLVTWYGEGRGRWCAACDQRILSRDTEIECGVPAGGTIVFHLACYDAWQSILAKKD
jgi:hypothetical protein